MIFGLLAFPGLIDARKDLEFLEGVYEEHNRQRDKFKLPALEVDGDLEDILTRLGYNEDGHDHRQKGNLQSHAVQVTGLSGYFDTKTGKPKDFKENVATSGNYKHTAKSLLSRWMASDDHKRTILDSRWGYMACGIGSRPSTIGRNKDYSYICAFIRDYKDNCIASENYPHLLDGDSSKPSSFGRSRAYC